MKWWFVATRCCRKDSTRHKTVQGSLLLGAWQGWELLKGTAGFEMNRCLRKAEGSKARELGTAWIPFRSTPRELNERSCNNLLPQDVHQVPKGAQTFGRRLRGDPVVAGWGCTSASAILTSFQSRATDFCHLQSHKINSTKSNARNL